MEKMAKPTNYGVIIVPYFVWKTNYISPFTYGPKKTCGYVFMLVMILYKKPPLQLFYHDESLDLKNGHYEPIIFDIFHGYM